MGTQRIPGLVLTDHEFDLPLDHERPDGRAIHVYAREVVDPRKEDDNLPWLVFLQGGPGSPAPRPNDASGWLKRALSEFRVLLLDQRGTGRSTPVTAQTLAWVGAPEAQAEYLTHFRADSIVRDAEQIRRQLAGEGSRWSVLGQSFGGFCAVRYLSAAPEGLREVFITGGLPPLERSADDVYRATYRRVLEKNRRYYESYREDIALVRTIVDLLSRSDVTLPSGDRLTVQRFQQIGLAFGGGDGFEHIHYLLESALVNGPDGPELSYPFLKAMDKELSFDTNPIFAILHEAIYCQGSASQWAASRIRSEFPEFDPESEGPLFFTGEMIYPWMFEEYGQLRPLRDAAEILAAHDSWPDLYDRAALERNTVPCAALAYYNDMYVERAYSEETARSIQGLGLWVTSEYEHSGLRNDGEKILDRLIALARGL